jgi:hypothetical protein
VRYQSVNRVYRIDVTGGDFCFYVAPDPSAAAKAHAARLGNKKLRNGQKAIEVPADRILTVGFNDCAEAIAHMTGADPAVIRPSLQGMPLADEFVSIRRAAEQWARSVRPGTSRFLWTSEGNH